MLYYYHHGGSGNHGCEAIVRATTALLDTPAALFTFAPEEDHAYGLSDTIQILPDMATPPAPRSLARFACALSHKLHGDDYLYVKMSHKAMLDRVTRGDICLSVGGDTYCYGEEGNKILEYYNRMLREQGAKTVLWGCSVSPEALTDRVVRDLSGYSLITVRESISYDALKAVGLTNIIRTVDPAFCLPVTDTPLPIGLREGNTVGINISPLATACGEAVFENFRGLIRFIIEETDMDVLLLPHVVKPESDDRGPLRRLLALFSEHNGTARTRIALAEDRDCMALKGMISHCRFFVGARTHATIAAYSTCVPTLVAGYSVKARGIAKDLFGDETNYVLPVQNMKGTTDLTEGFRWLQSNEERIRVHLQKTIPAYVSMAYKGADAVRKLL